MALRQPVCGRDLEHDPHEHDREDRRHWCAGWTAAEADLAVMVARVRAMMDRDAQPGRTYRLECGWQVASGLRLLIPVTLHQADPAGELGGAELVVIAGWPAGRWQLIEVPPPLEAGTIRPAPAAASTEQLAALGYAPA